MGKLIDSSLFSLSDFRPYLRHWANARGRGEFRRIAQKLRMHTTLVSQVLNGRKCFTEDQAAQLCAHMGLTLLESDYFLKLIQMERAGAPALKSLYDRHLQELRLKAKEAKSRVQESKPMSEQDRALFYSSWQYGYVRLLTSIGDFQTPEAISRRMELSSSRVTEILDFLVSRGLCRKTTDGRVVRTELNTHVEAQAALAVRHHQNWRARSIELQETPGRDDLSFTAPVSLARKDIPAIREILLSAIAGVAKQVKDSPSEEIAYLGIDWIEL